MFTMDMTGTKWDIFQAAVELISDNTFEGISIKDISNKVGIKPASIYNHFRSKDEILDTIYQYLDLFYIDNGMPGAAERYKDAENGDIIDMILNKWRWPEDMHDMLRRILRIVISRMHFDKKAFSLFHSTAIKWHYKLDKPFLEKLVELNRVDDFDIEAYLIVKIAYDVYATLLFTWNDTLPDDLWMRAEELLVKRVILKQD